jgi:DNA-binding transcriptional LysR family regulator
MSEFEDLQTFVEVCDAGGVSPAARRLGVSKSIVSRRLIRLEATLGVQLLARTTRGAVVTEAGVMFRDHASRICAEMEAARESLSQGGDLRGHLRISAPLALGPTHFVPVFLELAHRHPQLHVHTSYSERHVDIIAGGFDCAVRVGTLQDSSLVARRVGTIYGKLVASPDYIKKFGTPETPADILGHEALMLGTERWNFLDGEKVISVNPQGRFKADHGAALAAAAAAGLGIAWLPDCLVDGYLESGALVEVMKRYPPTTAGIFVVRPPGQYAPRKVHVLAELMVEHFGEGQLSS